MACFFREDAEKLQQVIVEREPNAQVTVHKRFWKHEWFVRVVRASGTRMEYHDINHYWLESCLLATFGKGR